MTSHAHPLLPELAACGALLRLLANAGQAERAVSQNADVDKTRNDLAARLPQIADTARDAALDPARLSTNLHPDGWVHGPVAYGKPRIVPAITVRWDVAGPMPYLQLMAVLAVAGSTAAGPGGLQATAYRYETAEETTHNFDHAQPSLSLVKIGRPLLPGVTGPLNTSSPAFPLDSTGLVGLTMCTLRALYGGKKFGSWLSQNPAVRTAVGPFLGQMPAFAARTAAARAAGAFRT